jgi:hypothetical protein
MAHPLYILYFTLHNKNIQINRDEIDKECSTHGSPMHTKFWFENLKERTTRKTDVCGRSILICVLGK